MFHAYHASRACLNRSSENKQFPISARCFTGQRLMYKVLGQTLRHENIITNIHTLDIFVFHHDGSIKHDGVP